MSDDIKLLLARASIQYSILMVCMLFLVFISMLILGPFVLKSVAKVGLVLMLVYLLSSADYVAALYAEDNPFIEVYKKIVQISKLLSIALACVALSAWVFIYV